MAAWTERQIQVDRQTDRVVVDREIVRYIAIIDRQTGGERQIDRHIQTVSIIGR